MRRTIFVFRRRACGSLLQSAITSTPGCVWMGLGLLGVHPVGDLLRLARGGEDGGFVGAQDLD
jgi:hypothetical protein